MSNVLEVKNLKTYFYTDEGVVKAVDDVSFSVEKGKTLGLVGESGCGKSVTAMSISRLISPPGRIAGGEILLSGRNLLALNNEEMRQVRGSQISMIFQEPMTALNPVLTVGFQIAEAVLAHERVSRREAWSRAVEAMRAVAIPDAEKRAKDYPHQLSGGMRDGGCDVRRQNRRDRTGDGRFPQSEASIHAGLAAVCSTARFQCSEEGSAGCDRRNGPQSSPPAGRLLVRPALLQEDRRMHALTNSAGACLGEPGGPLHSCLMWPNLF